MTLPSAYKEVEYIESSGTQYFKLGNQFKTSYKSVIDFQMNTIGGDYIPLGMRDDAGYRYGLDVRNGYFTVISGGGDWTNLRAEDKNRHTITIDKNTAIFDGTNYSIQYTNYTFNFGIGVFCYCRGGATFTNIPYMKMYKLDIYDENGIHIYDLVPCYRKSDNVTGMYDLVNDQFYTNAGTGTFIRGPIKDKGIPDDYTLVEYIESSGTQYIESGYIPNGNTKIASKFACTNTTTNNCPLFGAGTTSDTNQYVLWTTTTSITGEDGHALFSAPSAWSGTAYVKELPKITPGDIIEFRYDKTGGKYGSTTWTRNLSGGSAGQNMLIFGLRRNGIHSNKFKGKLFYFKIRDSGTLYRDMVPVIRKSDNKPGLYDIVTDTFYTNAGTGEFNYKKYPEYGKIQKIYIGVNQSRPGLSEHTVVYDDVPFKTNYTIAESGYNIKQIILEWSAHYSLTSWQVDELFLTSPSNSDLRLRMTGQLGGTYGYDYGEGIGKYIGQTFDVNSYANHYSVFASPSSSYAGTYDNAGYITITKDTVDYKIGQTYGTWLWTGTVTLSAQLKGYMETLLNSDDIYYKRNTWGDNNDLFTYYKTTVTYEPV